MGDLVVEKIEADGETLLVTLTGDDRAMLENDGRAFVISHVRKSANYNSWGQAGVERSSGLAAYDPKVDEATAAKVDVYEQAKQAQAKNETLVWRYRQSFRLTKMI